MARAYGNCTTALLTRSRANAIKYFNEKRVVDDASTPGSIRRRRQGTTAARNARLEQMTVIDYKGYRIEVLPVGKGWRASIFSPGSIRPWPNSPANLEKSSEEELVAEAKRIIDVRLGPRVL